MATSKFLDLVNVGPDAVENSTDVLREVRELGPVVWIPELDAYAVTRFSEVSKVLMDHETFSSQLAAPQGPRTRQRVVAKRTRMAEASVEMQALLRRLTPETDWRAINILTSADPPLHTRQRQLCNRPFTPPRVARIEDRASDIVHDLIDELEPHSEIDFVERFGKVFPLRVIAEQLGLEPDRHDDFRRWSDDFVVTLGNDTLPDEIVVDQTRTHVEMGEFFRRKLAEKRASPSDDIISVIANAPDDQVTELERVAIGCQLLAAGLETTAKMLAEAAAYLALYPELREQLRERPQQIETFVEEVVRLGSPSQGLYRFARHDTELAGVPIPAGSAVLVLFGSANRTAEEFGETAERIDLHRQNPRGHLGFGKGVHFCVGASLARMEGRVAVRALLERIDGWRVLEARRFPSYLLRGYASLRIQLGDIAPRSAAHLGPAPTSN